MSAPTNITSTAPKRIYLDIGDQFAVEAVAAGTQRWDLLEGVTWSEDNATSCGIPYVRADLATPPAASGAAPADEQGEFLVPGVDLPPLPLTDWRLYSMGNRTSARGYTPADMSLFAARYGQAVSRHVAALASREAAQPEGQENKMADLRRRLAVLATFAHEVQIGSMSEHEQIAEAAAALKVTGLSLLNDVAALADDEAGAAAPVEGEAQPNEAQLLALVFDSPGEDVFLMPRQREAAIERGRERYAAFLAAAPKEKP